MHKEQVEATTKHHEPVRLKLFQCKSVTLTVCMSLCYADLLILWLFPFIHFSTPPFPAIENKAFRSHHVSNTVPFLSPWFPSHLHRNKTKMLSLHSMCVHNSDGHIDMTVLVCFRPATKVMIYYMERHWHCKNWALTRMLENEHPSGVILAFQQLITIAQTPWGI